jgi:hypothetical protein|nr:MAG TPA: hypothetical protein [Caudoviricetes sp.]
MGKYLKGYVLSFISMVILNMIFHIKTSHFQVIILTIIWGVLSICDVIENTARYKNHYNMVDEFHRALTKKIELQEKLRGK